MFEDYIASFLQTFETILVKKFLVEFKVVSRIQMCWFISIRVEKKREKKMKMLLMSLFFRWHMRATLQMPVQAQKSHFV